MKREASDSSINLDNGEGLNVEINAKGDGDFLQDRGGFEWLTKREGSQKTH